MKPSYENINISDSQTLNSSCFLSLPSEPPDIGNWLSSYEYESPGFGTNITFVEQIPVDNSCEKEGDGFAKDNESEENFPWSRETRKQNDLDVSDKKCKYVFEENKHGDLSDVPDSLSPPSIVSAPPDIRNWFSSYVYESPGFTASSFYEVSTFEENEFKKYEFVEDSSTKKGEGPVENRRMRNRVELLYGDKIFSNESQNHEIHYELGMKSQIEDNRRIGSGKDAENITEKEDIMIQLNKRPELYIGDKRQGVRIEVRKSLSSAIELAATSGDRYLGEPPAEEHVLEKKFPLQESNNEKQAGQQLKTGISRCRDEIVNGGKVVSNIIGESNTSLAIIEVGLHSPEEDNRKSKGTDCLSHDSSIDCYHNSSDKSSGDNVLQSHVNGVKYVGKSNLDKETNFMAEELKETSENCYKDRINLVGAEFRQKFDCAESGSNLEGVYSLRISNCIGLEEPQDDGFVKTNKGRRIFKTSNENCNQRQEERYYNPLKENPKVSFCGKKDVMKRKILENTNIICSNVEVTGKWRCPQKSKPKLGPRLKQLRLDKWVNRM